uniref:Uncharacterized protein n=1 Tax=Panagrolaimus davidi TaxID=227884 RepID=A0A914R5C9_9BILA
MDVFKDKFGNFVPHICYSLNKSDGWEGLGSLENIVNIVAENDAGYPKAAIKCCKENLMKSCKRIVKVGENGGIQSYKIKSKRGTPLLSLLNRDSETSKKCENIKKRPVEEKLEDELLIMYKLNEWNSLDFDYRKDIKKIVTAKKLKKIRTNKILDFDFLNYYDVDFDEVEEENGMNEEIIVPAITSNLTIGDCFVAKTPKTRKRKRLNIYFETVEEEIRKIKILNSQSLKAFDELLTMGDEFVETFTQT